MKVKQDFLRFGTFIIKDGSQVRFWKKIWLDNRSLRDQYPQLYNIVRRKQDMVAEVLRTQIPNLSWCRDLIGNKVDDVEQSCFTSTNSGTKPREG